MKEVILFFLLALLIGNIPVNCQSISFDYDDSGNRTDRIIPLKSTGSSSSNDINPADEVFTDSSADMDIIIYPNPFTSELNIEISGTTDNKPVSLILLDFSGKLILTRENASEITTLNLSGLAPGNYFLQIKAGSKTIPWKIVKE